MKISVSLIFFLLSVENAAASFMFSFTNLLFMLHASDKPPDCNGPLRPKLFCENICPETVSSSRRQLQPYHDYNWTASACEYIQHNPWYSKCLEGSVTSCDDVDADATYVAADAYVDAATYSDETSIQGGIVSMSKTSFLPYIIAATVATMFLALYIWKKKREEKELLNESLMDDEESFHGSVARRIGERRIAEATASAAAEPVPEVQFVSTTGYAMA